MMRKGSKHSEKSKRLISESKKGQKRKHSEATKRKMSAAQSGENHPMYGKKHSAETIRKMTGQKRSKETRRRISQALLNRNRKKNAKTARQILAETEKILRMREALDEA